MQLTAQRRNLSLARITRGPVLNITRDSVPRTARPDKLPPARSARPSAPVVAPVERAVLRINVGDVATVDGELCEILRIVGTWSGGVIANVYAGGEVRRHVLVRGEVRS